MPRCDYLILTPTYNRSHLLERQIGQLCQESIQMACNVVHIIVDDCSPDKKAYAKLISRWKHVTPRYSLIYSRTPKHNGKPRFWKTFNQLFDHAKKYRFEYCIVTADDLDLCRDFLKRTNRHLRFMIEQEPRTLCLNIFSRFPTNWSTARYQDGAFICKRAFLEFLNWRVDRISEKRFEGPKFRRYRSSGVHQQITRRVAAADERMIAPTTGVSYVKPVETESVMHPQPDRVEKYWESNFVDD
jgi:glycosyltransferase involved in cell wall biosynthesis